MWGGRGRGSYLYLRLLQCLISVEVISLFFDFPPLICDPPSIPDCQVQDDASATVSGLPPLTLRQYIGTHFLSAGGGGGSVDAQLTALQQLARLVVSVRAHAASTYEVRVFSRNTGMLLVPAKQRPSGGTVPSGPGAPQIVVDLSPVAKIVAAYGGGSAAIKKPPAASSQPTSVASAQQQQHKRPGGGGFGAHPKVETELRNSPNRKAVSRQQQQQRPSTATTTTSPYLPAAAQQQRPGSSLGLYRGPNTGYNGGESEAILNLQDLALVPVSPRKVSVAY